MERIALNPHLSISRLVYGMWRLGDDENISAAHVQAKIEACLAQGITTMDQADIYGGYQSEEILGNALQAAPSLKGQIEIITKCGIIAPAGRHAKASVKYYDTSRAHIRRSVEDSLRLMGIEQIDLLLIHRPSPFIDHYETGKALDELIISGKVRSVGVSNFKRHDWTLLQSAMSSKLATNQIEMSLINNEVFSNGDLAFFQEIDIRPMAWSPLGGGALFSNQNAKLLSLIEQIADEQNVTAMAVALAWLLAHPAKIIPIIGTNKLSRIAAVSEAEKINISQEQWFMLYQAANGHEVP